VVGCPAQSGTEDGLLTVPHAAEELLLHCQLLWQLPAVSQQLQLATMLRTAVCCWRTCPWACSICT
jgi:hypothetical protein